MFIDFENRKVFSTKTSRQGPLKFKNLLPTFLNTSKYTLDMQSDEYGNHYIDTLKRAMHHQVTC